MSRWNKVSCVDLWKESIIEGRTTQYIKDSTEEFDDYFPQEKKILGQGVLLVISSFFVGDHNKEVIALVNITFYDIT